MEFYHIATATFRIIPNCTILIETFPRTFRRLVFPIILVFAIKSSQLEHLTSHPHTPIRLLFMRQKHVEGCLVFVMLQNEIWQFVAGFCSSLVRTGVLRVASSHPEKVMFLFVFDNNKNAYLHRKQNKKLSFLRHSLKLKLKTSSYATEFLLMDQESPLNN